MKRLLMAGVALSLCAAPALAQTQPSQSGLVNVNVQDVLRDIAVDLNVQDTNIPVTVQLPVNAAANVCGVSVDLLSARVATGDASCVAVTGSQELTQVVQQEMATGGSGTSAAQQPAQSGGAQAGATGGAETGTQAGATTEVEATGSAEAGAAGSSGQDAPRSTTASPATDATPQDTTGSVSGPGASSFAPGRKPGCEAPGRASDPECQPPGHRAGPARDFAPGQQMRRD